MAASIKDIKEVQIPQEYELIQGRICRGSRQLCSDTSS